MQRRDFLKQLIVLSTGLAAGCGRIPDGPVTPGGGQHLIDAHCHLFNASDLPVQRFLRQVFMKDYPEQTEVRTAGVRQMGPIDLIYEVAVRLLGANKAPTADDEIKFLQGKDGGEESAKSVGRARAAAIDLTADFLVELDEKQRSAGAEIMRQSADTKPAKAAAADQYILDYFLATRSKATQLDRTPLGKTEARAASARAFGGSDIVSRYLNWFSLFLLYRHVLVDRLTADIEKQGFKVDLLTPALVDYDEWLFQDVTDSPLRRQMIAMDWVSRRRKGPAVHGYMGFDPLREVAQRAGVKGATVSSLETVRMALEEHGFIGAKLYPPMGFRASGNKGPYPQRTEDRLGFDPSKRLDKALDALYALCVRLDAPILAHAFPSNEAGPEYGLRADPAFWIPVLQRPENAGLRVCLGHFGAFRLPPDRPKSDPMPESGWEWRIGEYIRDHPEQRIFVDISYFSEALNAETKERDYLKKSFTRWVDEFDKGLDHVLFGTDWIMIGQEAGYEHYVKTINAFLRGDCNFSDEACEKIFRSNALRFLPLEQGACGRERLLKWYARNNVDPNRLPAPPADWRPPFLPCR